MSQLLNLKGVFAGLDTNDANMHLANFIRIQTSYTIPGVDQGARRLRLFPFSFNRETSLWLGEHPRGYITT